MNIKDIIYLPILFSVFLTSCSSMSFATPTPTATSVPPTNTPQPTDTPLPTSTVTPMPSTNLEKLADGSWLYVDHEAGFQFQFGKSWYLEDVASLNIGEILDRTSQITTELGLKSTPQYFLEPQGMRVLGVYLDESIPDYMSVTFNATHIVDEDFAQMPLPAVQSRVIEVLSNAYEKDPQDFNPGIFSNDHGLEYGAVFFNLALNYLQMKIFFKTENGIGMITFGFSDKNIDILGPDWSLLTGSLEYTDQ